MNDQEPLIHTIKGNLPVASLTHTVGWEEHPAATVFWEEYRQGDEIVRRNVHVRSKFGVAGETVAASMGG